ncbi:LysR family transcriptional regulator [Cognatiyoonia sp. IB215446]|uniref:LysR family transcriptional regulator n=1 Tax=Cognatiyoonia sp. IB215446 TaxID=3097355 RepID=UPI002A0BD33D|nr:LysR family transcriptional regulator [Cognatiyoonia sp. IB215446]MDX8349110.1 LysR family transcriptional regulator [Cognatiyoonia sp. IB215446]
MDYRCVVALSEEKSFSQASEILGISQPALTARLRRIEENLGVRLFERGRRGAKPTPAGDAFIDAAQRIIDMADRSVEVARDADRGLGQHLRIGMTQIAAVQVVVPILKAFREENAFARVRLTESISSTLEAQVEQNLIDVAFLHPPVHQAGLSELPLMSQRLVKYDAMASPHDRPPTIRYTRRDAPVLVAELDRHEPAGVEADALAEVDTAIGAIVMSHAGYGPFVVPEGFPSPFNRSETCPGGAPLKAELGTSIVWRSLDRRPMVRALIEICRRS